MSILNQGRNEIRVNNSGAKCLLENWVEERSVSHIDPQELKEGQIGAAQLFKDGHKGVLTTEFDSKLNNLTTVRATYTPPQYPGVPVKGIKQSMLERAFAEQARDEYRRDQMEKTFRPEEEPTDYRTEFRDNFTKQFQTQRPLPTRPHDVSYEQPVTFWTEHRERVTGVTNVKTRDTVFRKNAAFSTPIHESWNETQPYGLENVPNM